MLNRISNAIFGPPKIVNPQKLRKFVTNNITNSHGQRDIYYDGNFVASFIDYNYNGYVGIIYTDEAYRGYGIDKFMLVNAVSLMDPGCDIYYVIDKGNKLFTDVFTEAKYIEPGPVFRGITGGGYLLSSDVVKNST